MKISWDIIGHKKILDLLEKHIENLSLHAYLFVGEPNLGKKAVAKQFIKALQCQSKKKKPCGECISCSQFKAGTHPDITVIEKEAPKNSSSVSAKKEGEIRIDQIRELKRILSLTPASSPYKVCFIKEADKMNREASNALLKILEEPLGRTIFILVAPHIKTLLPTVVSRCQIIKFFPVSKDLVLRKLAKKTSLKKAEEIAALSGGKPGRALKLLLNPEIVSFYRDSLKTLFRLVRGDTIERFKEVEKMSKNLVETEKTLNIWLSFFRDLILLKTSNADYFLNPNFEEKLLEYSKKYSLGEIKEIIRSILETKKLFLQNVNPRLSLESIFLKI